MRPLLRADHYAVDGGGWGWVVPDGQSHGSMAESPEAIQICLEHGADVDTLFNDRL